MHTIITLLLFSVLTLQAILATSMRQCDTRSVSTEETSPSTVYSYPSAVDSQGFKHLASNTIDTQEHELKNSLMVGMDENSKINAYTFSEKIPSARATGTEAQTSFTVEIQKIAEEIAKEHREPSGNLESYQSSKHSQYLVTYIQDLKTGQRRMQEQQKIHYLYEDNFNGEDTWQREYQHQLSEWSRTSFEKKYETVIGRQLGTKKTADFISKETGCYRIRSISGPPTRFFILHTEFTNKQKEETTEKLHLVYNTKEADDPPTYLIEIVDWDGRQLTIDGKAVAIPTGKRTCKYKYGEVVLPITLYDKEVEP